MQHFKVEKKEAENFAKIWRSKSGLIGTIDTHAIAFATDFANVVLWNFIDMCKQNVQNAKADQHSSAPINENKLIVEA